MFYYFWSYILFCWIKLRTFTVVLNFILFYHNLFNKPKAWKPKCLDIEPSSPTAARDHHHWWTILLNYIEDFHDKIPNKYRAILSCITSRVFEYIEGYTDFKVAIEKLDAIFIKMPNEVFARHLLAMRRLKLGESLDEFFRGLEKLKKNCNFRDHTAEEYMVMKLCSMPSSLAWAHIP